MSLIKTVKEIRDKIEEAGIKIEPDEHFMANPEPMTICAKKCSESSNPVAGSGEAHCSSCKELLWLAPSSQKILIERLTRGFKTTTLCIQCILSLYPGLDDKEEEQAV